MKLYSKLILIFLVLSILPFSGNAQQTDATNTREPYPYLFPILGKKAYEKGYNFPLPHGVLLGTIYNKQGIELNGFEMAIAEPGLPESDLNYTGLEGILDFGPEWQWRFQLQILLPKSILSKKKVEQNN